MAGMADADLDMGLLHDSGTGIECPALREGSADSVIPTKSLNFADVMSEVDDGAVKVAFHEIKITRKPWFIDGHGKTGIGAGTVEFTMR
jgi:hypothetical protein